MTHIIKFGWGGCGNLINYLLKSPDYYDEIIAYYRAINTADTWTNQEWNLRQKIGSNIDHETGSYEIGLAWDNSLDTSFHYLIKNINVNHVEGTIEYKIRTVLYFNEREESQIRSNPYWSMTVLLQDFDKLLAQCQHVDDRIRRNQAATIFNLWQDQTRKFYELNSNQVLSYFHDLGLDYTPTTIYNILYENINIRQHRI